MPTIICSTSSGDKKFRNNGIMVACNTVVSMRIFLSIVLLHFPTIFLGLLQAFFASGRRRPHQKNKMAIEKLGGIRSDTRLEGCIWLLHAPGRVALSGAAASFPRRPSGLCHLRGRRNLGTQHAATGRRTRQRPSYLSTLRMRLSINHVWPISRGLHHGAGE